MQIGMQMQQTQTLSKMWATTSTTQNHNCCHDARLENTTAQFFLFHWKIIILCSSILHHQIAVQARGTVDKKVLGWPILKKNK